MDDRVAKNADHEHEIRKLKPDVRAAASESLMKILQGLSRFCIEHGLGKSEVETAVLRSLVAQARETCRQHGQDPNVSRLAVITGITRKRVKELRHDLDRNVGPSDLPAGKLVRLVDIWQTDPAFLDESGRPRALEFSSPRQGEFGVLSREAAGDIPPTALLRELERMGAVQKTDTHVELVSHELLANSENDNGLFAIKVAGDAIQDLLATINNNLAPGTKPLLERRVLADSLSNQDLQDFRVFAENLAREFLETLNRWVLDRQRGDESIKQPANDRPRRHRAGVGVYVFQGMDESEKA